MYAEHYQYPVMPLIEHFKIIDFYNIKSNMYAISEFGEIINIRTNKILSQATSYTSGGYRSVGLQLNNNKRKNFLVHRLVAMAFIPKTIDDIINDRDTVNHKDFHTDNNYIQNLEWTTLQENTIHGYIFKQEKDEEKQPLITRIWGNSNSCGENNGMSKLTNDQVNLICSLIDLNYSVEDILNYLHFPINSNNRHLIYNIRLGRRWKSISCNYNFMKEK